MYPCCIYANKLVSYLKLGTLTVLVSSGRLLAASAAVFCTQPHVVLLKYGEI